VTADSVATSSSSARYRPYLDGLRAVAVYLVVAFHAGLGLLSGGFVGVDVFFVLSGFLVTGILMRDLTSTSNIRWRSFYARRVRRILPAALVALLVTAIVYSIIASPLEMFDALGGFRAAFFYVANWFFIHQATDYFAANVNSNPVLHFWSLAVEEQFYLIWPLLLGALYLITGRAKRRRWWILRSIVLVAGIASAIAAWHIGSTNLERAYYGTDTRAYQLLAGAALALTPQLLHLKQRGRDAARLVSAIALGALLVLATSALSMSAITRGILVAAIAVTLIVALEHDRGGLTKRVLSSPPLTYLGRISYGIYLWHWPVIVVAAHGHDLSPVELFAIATPTATALAALSFHLLEHPVRVSRVLDRFRTPVIAIGFTTSILVGVLVIPAVLHTQNTGLAALAAADKGKPGPKLLDWQTAINSYVPLGFHDCYAKPVEECTIVKGTGRSIVLVGDSVARMWIPAFTQLAKKESLTFSVATYQGCPWQQGMNYQGALAIQIACTAHQKDWYNRIIPQLHPDIVFVAQHAPDDPHEPSNFVLLGGHKISVGKPDFESTLAAESAATLRTLRQPGRQVVILEPVPVPRTSPLTCLSLDRPIPACAFTTATAPTPLERYFRKVAASDSIVTSVDLDRVVCPRLPTCDAVVGDIIAWRDTAHVTAVYARALEPQLAAVLARRHVLRP
jgi:peptidoglycan/LPS O-acetylase OafA/YrhL